MLLSPCLPAPSDAHQVAKKRHWPSRHWVQVSAQPLSPCVTMHVSFPLADLSFPTFKAEGLSLPPGTFLPNILLCSRLQNPWPGL